MEQDKFKLTTVTGHIVLSTVILQPLDTNMKSYHLPLHHSREQKESRKDW